MSALPVVRRARRRLRHNPLARGVRSAMLTGVDGVERALSGTASGCPPRRLRGVGAGDFRAVGSALVDQLVLAAGLRAGDHVLDVGCGSGRLALPLTGFLASGRYEGFDIDAEMIAWCRRNITPKHPRFGFSLVNVANAHYNPGGALRADMVRFPFSAHRFDIAVATSLFTHLLPAGLANYAAESARVLRPGGTLFATFCLVDDAVLRRVERGEAAVALRHRLRDEAGVEYHALDPASPETAVGFSEAHVRETFAAAGLRVSAIHAGTWSGRPQGFSFQDVVIAHAAGPARRLVAVS